MLENLANLYQELILEHSKNPRNTGVIESPTSKKGLGINPSCGDKLVLSVDIQNSIITDIKHDSDGCAIFRSSCSLMSQLIKDKSVDEAQEILSIFIELITFHEQNTLTQEKLNILGKLQIFENIANYPARVKCAALFARTLQDLLTNFDSSETEITVSTEDNY